jgi:hypothetical protein
VKIPICRVCGKAKPLEEMVMRSPVHCDTLCKACKREASQRAAAKAKIEQPVPVPTPAPRSSSHDPCPVCGTAQAAHWKCRQCGSRGHQMGRGTALPHLCGWCEEVALKAEAQGQPKGKKAA